jgi:hypothetical protein
VSNRRRITAHADPMLCPNKRHLRGDPTWSA